MQMGIVKRFLDLEDRGRGMQLVTSSRVSIN